MSTTFFQLVKGEMFSREPQTYMNKRGKMSDNETILQPRFQPWVVKELSDRLISPEQDPTGAFGRMCLCALGACTGVANLESGEPGAAHSHDPWSLNNTYTPRVHTHTHTHTKLLSKRTEGDRQRSELRNRENKGVSFDDVS